MSFPSIVKAGKQYERCGKCERIQKGQFIHPLPSGSYAYYQQPTIVGKLENKIDIYCPYCGLMDTFEAESIGVNMQSGKLSIAEVLFLKCNHEIVVFDNYWYVYTGILVGMGVVKKAISLKAIIRFLNKKL